MLKCLNGTLSPCHKISTGPMSFLGGTPSPSHNTSTGPMSFRGHPSDWLQVPSWGSTPVPCGGYPLMGYHLVKSGWVPPPGWDGVPTPGRDGVPPDRSGWGTPPSWDGVPSWLGQDGAPLPQDRFCLDRLCRGQYAFCSFPQEDFLVPFIFTESSCTASFHSEHKR